MYDYREAIRSDIMDYIRENYSGGCNMTRDELIDTLNDELWVCDRVTGNASGSYWCNTYKAEEALCHNWDLLKEAMQEFCCDDINAIYKGAEWCDVTIRCYLLGECLEAALDDLEEEIGVLAAD